MFRKLFQQQKSQHDQDRRDQHPQKPPAQRKRQQKSNARPDQKQPEPLGLYTHKKSPLSAYAGRRNLCGSERVLQLPAHGLFAAGDEAAVDAALRPAPRVCRAGRSVPCPPRGSARHGGRFSAGGRSYCDRILPAAAGAEQLPSCPLPGEIQSGRTVLAGCARCRLRVQCRRSFCILPL